MKGLLIKDFYVILKQLKLFVAIIGVLALINGGMAQFALFMCAAFPLTAISYDEQSKWNDFAIMLPYKKRDLALSKYILGYLSVFVVAISSTLTQFIFSLIKTSPTDFTFSTLFMATGIALSFIALEMPIFLKFGVEKGRLAFILYIVFVSVIMDLLNKTSTDVYFLITFPSYIYFLIVLGINAISIYISTRIQI